MFQPLFYFVFSLSLAISQSGFAASSAAEVYELALKKNLHQERQWQKLLHFEPGFLGKLSTQIATPSFFLAENGGSDLQAELKATIFAFWDSPLTTEENTYQCRYPARYLFLKKHLPEVKNWPDRDCPRYLKYLNALNGTSLSLVFSSFYLDNPSSAFGHTFVRINKKPATDGKRYELLDYGINYAANVDTDSAVLYGIKGLFGMFNGTFSSLPYYFKVREYNNAESRDLWEYELNITPEEVETYVAHTWELGPVKFQYWYLTENCSYHMLTSIEAAAPNVDVVSKLKKWVIPSDTVKVVWEAPGLVKGFHYRPSVRTEFFNRQAVLTDNERAQLKELIDSKNVDALAQNLSLDSQRKVLDAGIDYMDFKFMNEIALTEGEPTKFKRKLLVARSQIDVVTPQLALPVPQDQQPHIGHGSRKVSLGLLGSQQGEDASLFGLKYALHDHYDLVMGYPEYAAITFGDFQFSHSRIRQKLELETFTLIGVTSYNPLTPFSRKPSWGIRVGAEKMKDQNCLNCHGAFFEGTVGYTLGIKEGMSFFGGVKGITYYTPYGTGHRFLLGAGPSAQLRLRWTDHAITILEGWYKRNLNSEFSEFHQYSIGHQQTLNSEWAVKVLGTDLQYDKRAQFEILYFY